MKKAILLVAACAASLMTLGAYDANATCFTSGQMQSWISGHWISIGAAPGDPEPGDVFNVTAETNGYMQGFQNGEIWADACQSTEIGGWVHGAILTKYLGLSGGNGIMTYPTSDEEETPSGDGRMNTFEAGAGGFSDGAIFWSSSSGAFIDAW